MARTIPQVCTISPGTDFVACMVEALLDGKLLPARYRDEPEKLADLTIFVPTQRVRATLRDQLYAATAPLPVLLPRIRALGEPWDPLEETLDVVDESNEPEPVRSLDSLRRRFMLLPLVSAWHGALHRLAGTEAAEAAEAVAIGPHAMRERLALADALGRLIDEIIIADLPLDLLAQAAPPGYDASRHDIYWEQTRRFLQIAAEAWPRALAEEGFEDGKALRRAALDAEAKRIHVGLPGAFLVAGSTGSVPATARLMRAIARHDAGAVILPGLDLGLGQASWDLIGDEAASLATRFAHAQSHLKSTLATIGLPREAVQVLDSPGPRACARNHLISQSLSPAETVHRWRDALTSLDLPLATDGLTVLEASDPRREALAIAMLIRETLETPGKKVALVTADRSLAVRVQTELKRWQIEINDSAGTRLKDLQAGRLALLVLRAVEEPNGANMLALLRHPDIRLGMDESERDAAVTALEMLVLRQRQSPEPQTLVQRVERAFDAAESGQRKPEPALRAVVVAMAMRFDAVVEPLQRADFRPLDAMLDAFLATLDALTGPTEGLPAWRRHPSGSHVGALVDSLRRAGAGHAGHGAELREILRTSLSETVLPAEGGHPRALILGPLEARLLATDKLIVGGLNEGNLPPVAQDDPFLNRTMRLHLGLTPPERRIGQSAHDFQMLAGHHELVLSRAQQSGEGPAQPSRFWRRLEALCGAETWKALKARGEAVLALSGRLDEWEGPQGPVTRPAPVPARPRVPERLSITEVETLWHDPFALYARHFLKLDVPDPIDPPFDARDRGTLVHRCLERYAAETPPADRESAESRLLAIGREVFHEVRGDPARHAFWWRPFERLVPAFVAFDQQRRDLGFAVMTERRARYPVTLPGGERVMVVGKADRLELASDGTLAIFDYKTGSTKPSKKALVEGLVPQLPITGALALRSAFEGLPTPKTLIELGYLRVGDHADGTIEPVLKGQEVQRSEELWDALIADLTKIADGEKGYTSRLNPMKDRGPGDFDHLARLREWDALGGLAQDDDGDVEDD